MKLGRGFILKNKKCALETYYILNRVERGQKFLKIKLV